MLDTGPPLRFMKVMGLASQISSPPMRTRASSAWCLPSWRKRAAMAARQLVHQPEAGVVARARIFGARDCRDPTMSLSALPAMSNAGPRDKNRGATRPSPLPREEVV